MFGQSHPTRCVSCRAVLANAPPEACPRCGTDNRAWLAWDQASRPEHLKRFFLGSPWGRLALVSILLPPVGWSVFDFEPASLDTASLVLSLMLSLGGLFCLFAGRDALWTGELAGRVSARFRLGLLGLGGMGFLAFVAVGGVLAVAWWRAALHGEILASLAPTDWEVMIMGLAFTGQTLAAGLYSLNAYGQWLLGSFPAPIFLDEARLRQLVEQSVESRLMIEAGWAESLVTRVVDATRTGQAGLSLKFRTETATEKVFEEQYLKAVRHWRVVADKWGRVKQLRPEGPLEYVPDPDRLYTPPAPEQFEPPLEGELIFPKRPTAPSLEEAVMTALTSDR